MLKIYLLLTLVFSTLATPSWACQTCTATSTYCTSYSTVCTSYGQQCDSYAYSCDGYATVCDNYEQQCNSYDDQGNCNSYSTVCTSYSQQCTGYSQHCTSYSTICTAYGQQCNSYETQCDSYEYADYITVQGKVKSTGNNQGLPDLTVTLSDTQSSSQSTGVTDSAGNYSLRIYAYDDSAGYITVNTCAYGKTGYTPSQVCEQTQVYDYCGSPTETKNLAITPAPFGYFDGFSQGSLNGWALDPKAPNTSIQVHFYQDDANGQKVFMGSTQAAGARPDVNTGTGYSGNHGFNWTLPQQFIYGPHKIYAYAVAVDNRYNPILTNSPYQYKGTLNGLTHAQIVGTDTGVETNVRVFNTQMSLVYEDTPYPSVTNGVRVALGDVNGDGTLDVITAPGKGAGPHVKVFNGKNGAILYSFFAYNSSLRGGMFVASGDVDHDGKADIITSYDSDTASQNVKVFSGANGTVIREFAAYAPSHKGGTRVASGDIDHDGWDDIALAPGAGGGPHVRIVNGRTGADIRSFFAYAPNFTRGLYIAVADVNADGYADVITGPDAGGGPHVQVFSGLTGVNLNGFFAYDSSFYGGIRVGSTYLNNDSNADILTVPGPLGGPHVRGFSGLNLIPLEGFFAQISTFRKGLFISGK